MTWRRYVLDRIFLHIKYRESGGAAEGAKTEDAYQ
jgi:hypothetical protein